jgi:hypothetical protein
MRTNDKHEAASRIAPRGLSLVGVLVTALICTGASSAQSSAALSPTPIAKPAAALASVASAPAAKAPVPPAAKPPSQGPHEGIAVHGYWIIDVRNPDGKLAKHMEFENQLCTTFVDPLEGATVQGGDSTLSSLMNGTASPGLWAISVGAPENTGNSGAVPNCAVTPYIYLSQDVTIVSNPLPDGTPASLSCNFNSASVLNISGPVASHCDRNLTVSNLASGVPGVSLSGGFGVPPGLQSLTISAVRTDLYTCTGSLGAPKPTDCQNIASEVSGNSCIVSSGTGFQGGSLTVPSTTNWTGCIPGDSNVVSIVTFPVSGLPAQSPFSGVVLTGANGVPGPFTVSQGQTVIVNWTLSFQ